MKQLLGFMLQAFVTLECLLPITLVEPWGGHLKQQPSSTSGADCVEASDPNAQASDHKGGVVEEEGTVLLFR